MKKKISTCITASLLYLCSFTAGAATIINGSFSDGFNDWFRDFSPDLQSFGRTDSFSAGGAVTLGQVDSLWQLVTDFIVDETYELSFYQQNNGSLLNPYDDGRASWEVLIGGASVFNSSLMNPGDANWTLQSFSFVASTETLRIEFRAFDIDNAAALAGDTGVYPVIDDISLTVSAVPLPPALWTLGAAFFSILGVVKKRKSS